MRLTDNRMKMKMKEYADVRRHATSTEFAKGNVVMVKQGRASKTDTVRNPQPADVYHVKEIMVTTLFPHEKTTCNKSFFKATPNVPLRSLLEQEPMSETWGRTGEETVEKDLGSQSVEVKDHDGSIAQRRQRRVVKKNLES